MGWTQFSYNVLGTGSDILTFSSATPGNYGPALDQVSLTAIPEPASGLICLAGLALLVSVRRASSRPTSPRQRT